MHACPCSVKIGSEDMVTINHLAEMVMEVAGKKPATRHVPGPLGVRAGNSEVRRQRSEVGRQRSEGVEIGV